MVARIQAGEIKPLTTDDKEIHRELTHEEKQVLAIQKNPYRLELFLMFTDAERDGDTKTQALIRPLLEDVELDITGDHVMEIKEKTRMDRVSSAIKDTML
jgi:hypothetical protein